MSRYRIFVLIIALCTFAGIAGSAGMASASTHARSVAVAHSATHVVPVQVKVLHRSSHMLELKISGHGARPDQPFDCDYTVTDTINRVVSTATAWLHTCVNVDYCAQVADLQMKDPGGVFLNVAAGQQTNGCSSAHKSVASVECQAASLFYTFRGLGIFTFLSDFGDQVGPFDSYTGGGDYLTVC